MKKMLGKQKLYDLVRGIGKNPELRELSVALDASHMQNSLPFSLTPDSRLPALAKKEKRKCEK